MAQSADKKRKTAFHRALHRPQQIMGGERELMLFSMLIAGTLVITAMNWVATAIGLFVWTLCIYGLRRMAKADPEMSKIYLRQLRYGVYYGPFSKYSRVSKSSRNY